MFDITPIRVFGTSSIGVFIATNNTVTFIPPDVPEKIDDAVRNTLRTSVARFTVARSPLLGIFTVVNDNGVLLPPLVLEEEVRLFKALGLNVDIINTKYTAISNLILAGNKVALVSPLLEPSARKVVADVLGVEVIVDTIAGNPLVGALAVLNSRGLLVAPEATDDDLKKLSEYFKVRVDVGTVNRGKSFLRGGIVVNDNGALVGDETAGPELMRMQQVLG
ncbi:translation initiation factor IF-6 [Pyrobaculum aerophilum]|uniref:Translation initiation factor 6 n=2 Tax=Pyrobaculum aerophilum TaxID=13773 RepID=IF6_PYRAE|nr:MULTISPECIES: translation initiation factor IF-6 [Pyrobaculum]Q8ZTU1.1 RecName: Full=Translation initiation factor 6; Short=aIF-6 [Pyrobaculum aerophilum str. IM2]AAL64668.1 translation initiation factor aIF-6 [Pyrobaculum aerophilum str. IM2]MCX8136524.1 translation initiation factor IF-6 [Pyrobaculum aerophilum]RFA93341.1 translation initiation factor 6 [Pyrobaculum aerophilum]RFA95766.1 translation initiation factor 6 [Pyrobaculum aerophilum]HII46187.1 translation initiation factor IF-6